MDKVLIILEYNSWLVVIILIIGKLHIVDVLLQPLHDFKNCHYKVYSHLFQRINKSEIHQRYSCILRSNTTICSYIRLRFEDNTDEPFITICSYSRLRFEVNTDEPIRQQRSSNIKFFPWLFSFSFLLINRCCYNFIWFKLVLKSSPGKHYTNGWEHLNSIRA